MKKWRDVHVVAMVTTITNIIMSIITTVIVKKTRVNVILTTNTTITTAIAKKTLVDVIITTSTIITTAIAKKTLVDVIITTNTITTAIAKKTANAQTKKESAIVEINANVMMTITADAKLTNNHPKKIKRSLILTSFF